MEPVPVLVIGLGMLGRGRAKIVREAPGFTLAAICRRDETLLQQAGDELGLPPAQCFVDPAEACRRSGAALTVLVTPPEDHADGVELAFSAGQLGVELAFSAGQHVICSKPLCESLEDSRHIRDLCRAHPNLRFVVDQPARWHGETEAIRQAVRSGLIGRLGYITWEFEQAVRFGGWRDEMAEVLLADMAVHHFDLMRHITGLDAVEVYARSFNPPWSWFHGNACATVVFQMEEGVQVTYFGSWAARGHRAWQSEVRIVGERGTVEWPFEGRPVAVLGRPERDGAEALAESLPPDSLPPVSSIHIQQGGRARRPDVIQPLPHATLEHGDFLHALHEISTSIEKDRPPVDCTIGDNLRTMAMVL